MKASIQSTTEPQAIDFGYVQGALRRLESMRSSEIDLVEPPSVVELDQALGEPVQKCELFAKNWRNRIYRIELGSGRLALAKQVIVGTDEMVRYQYDQLHALARLQIPGLRVPRGLAMLSEKRTYVMEFAPGKPIPRLIWERDTEGDLLPACELAGKSLARLQMARTDKIGLMPVDSLARDLAATPWRLSSREQNILEATLDRVAGVEVSMGQVYYDFKAANLLFKNNELFLVDPPDRLRQGAHLWDFASFRSSMRRHLWRFISRRPFDRRRVVIKQGLAVFDRNYLAHLSEPPRDPALFALAARLFELQRAALLMTMQKGKVVLAREKLPIARDNNLGDALMTRMTLPLFEIEKRWLFRQLARELRR